MEKFNDQEWRFNMRATRFITRILTPIITAACVLAAGAGQAHDHGPGVDFIQPKNGDTVASTFVVKFAVKGMKVAPAGDMTADTGHHHLLIDVPDVAEGDVIPMDDKHRHFGKGQTETEITLPPGRHRLTMQFADGAHRSYGAQYRKTIEVNVK